MGTVYKKIIIRRYRKWLRGWRREIEHGYPLNIALLAILEKNQKNIASVRWSGILPKGVTEMAAEACLRQVIFNYVRLSPEMSRSIVGYQTGCDQRLALSLPKSWLKVLEGEGCRISWFQCRWLFFRWVVTRYLQGGRSVFHTLKMLLLSQATSASRPYGVLVHMGQVHWPQRNDAVSPRDAVSWYKGWKGRDPQIEEIWVHVTRSTGECHHKNVTLVTHELPLPQLSSRFHGLQVATELLWLTATSGLAMFAGRWHGAVMLRELAHAVYGSHLPDRSWGREYLFNNSMPFFRPLWTYLAENAGARVSLFHYSANSLAIFPDRPPEALPGNGEGIANWSHYITMSEHHKQELIKARSTQVPVDIDPFISISDNGQSLGSKDLSHAVALFDISGWRPLFLARLGSSGLYYRPSTINGFLQTSIQLLSERGLTAAYKSKRKILTTRWELSKSYINLKKSFENNPDVIIIDPGITALRVIECCCAVISVPFTSTAIIGKVLGKPSVYFDPIGTISSSTPLVHGVPVVSGEKELAQWLDREVLPHLATSNAPRPNQSPDLTHVEPSREDKIMSVLSANNSASAWE
ncbi:MAG: polysaccharide biosynthesis PFTS motif protein [Nitrospirae bacterium]|nr:polysaccharide biosynthesis PFTS motif protein [Magnetococcales bacterium]HAT50700.1 hypothetical protein [Alphaproteobacteria bacterium]